MPQATCKRLLKRGWLQHSMSNTVICLLSIGKLGMFCRAKMLNSWNDAHPPESIFGGVQAVPNTAASDHFRAKIVLLSNLIAASRVGTT